MTFLEFILLLIIAGITGGIARALIGFSRGGCIVSIVVGFIGAAIGPWIAKKINLPEMLVINIGDVSFPVIWAIIGAIIFTGILSLITPRRRN